MTPVRLIAIGVSLAALAMGFAAIDQTQASTISLNDVRNYWGAEDGSGATVADSIGGADGTLLKAAAGTLPTFSTSAKVGTYALDFPLDGQSVMDINAALDSSLTTNGFSWACWLRADSAGHGGYGRIITSRSGNGMTVLLDSSTTAGDLDGNTNTVGLRGEFTYTSPPPAIISPDAITFGQWYHLVVTRSATDSEGKTLLTLYLDGNSVVSGTYMAYDTCLLVGNASNYTSSTSHREFDGLMDEMVLFDRELTGAEVQDFYTNMGGVVANIPVPEPSVLVLMTCGLLGLLAYAWRKRK